MEIQRRPRPAKQQQSTGQTSVPSLSPPPSPPLTLACYLESIQPATSPLFLGGGHISGYSGEFPALNEDHRLSKLSSVDKVRANKMVLLGGKQRGEDSQAPALFKLVQVSGTDAQIHTTQAQVQQGAPPFGQSHIVSEISYD